MAKKLRIGDKIVFHDSKANRDRRALNMDWCDITLGRVYTTEGADPDGVFFCDDSYEMNYAANKGNGLKYTKIVD